MIDAVDWADHHVAGVEKIFDQPECLLLATVVVVELSARLLGKAALLACRRLASKPRSSSASAAGKPAAVDVYYTKIV